MLERGKMERGVFKVVDTESLLPAEHLLRKCGNGRGIKSLLYN